MALATGTPKKGCIIFFWFNIRYRKVCYAPVIRNSSRNVTRAAVCTVYIDWAADSIWGQTCGSVG